VDLSIENGGSVHGFWLTFTRPGMSGDSDLITEHVLANQWRATPNQESGNWLVVQCAHLEK